METATPTERLSGRQGNGMTEKLYVEDAYLSECDATVIEVTEDAIVLDRTVFYPTGGGQPGDAGRLVWDGGSCDVITARKGDGGAVLHVPADGSGRPPVGTAVRAEIDAPTRACYRRCHTALHLLSVVIPLPVTGGAIGAQKGRLDFDMAEPPADKAVLEARLNAFVSADHPVAAEWITDAELEANPDLVKTMSAKPPVGQGHVRLVRIGSAEATIDLQPCGGTHVRSTSEIGPVRIGKLEKKGRQNRRVSIHLV